jgi:predicted phosphodiesterase
MHGRVPARRYTSMISVLAMSDSHRRHNRFTLPEADVFIHAGDFSNFGSGAEEFAVWYWQLPYKHRFVVLGNHEGKDATAERSPETWRKLFGPTLLHNEAAAIALEDKRLLIYGAPYGTRDFAGAPSGLSILVTHEPPLKMLDRHIGSEEVAQGIRSLRPALHLFGHVHQLGGRSAFSEGTLHVNAATRAVLIDVGDIATVRRCIMPRGRESVSFRD